MTSALTPTAQLAEIILNEPLDRFIRSRRMQGRSWRLIQRDLYEATGHKIDVTYETLRSWFPDERRSA